MASGIIMRAEQLRSLGFASMGASYVAIGSELTKPARLLILQNTTDANLMLSFKVDTDHIVVVAKSAFVLDLTANKTISSGFFIEVGTQLSVKNIDTPTEGSIYVSVLYSKK